jgi:hypothetical protein
VRSIHSPPRVEGLWILILSDIDAEATKESKTLKSKIKENLSEMETVVKHLNDITSYSKVNQERQVKSLSLRHAPIKLPEEHCTFPIKMIPRARNEDFYGRLDELSRINQYLDCRGNSNLRTYQIYGRYVFTIPPPSSRTISVYRLFALVQSHLLLFCRELCTQLTLIGAGLAKRLLP